MRLIEWMFANGDMKVAPEHIQRSKNNVVIIDATEAAKPLQNTLYPGLREAGAVLSPPFIDTPLWVEATLDGELPGERFVVGASVFCGMVYEDDEWFVKNAEYRSDMCWAIVLWGYLAEKRGGTFVDVTDAYGYIMSIPVGRDGAPLDDPVISAADDSMLPVPDDKAELLGWAAITVGIAFDLLNRRTEVDEITPSRAEKRQAARAFGQKGTYPLRNYYMLKVKPQKPGYTGPPKPLRQSGIGKRLHAVRGHFRRVPDTGLFGRGDKAGELLWIPNHTRGDSSLGKIVKGYKVEPGDN